MAGNANSGGRNSKSKAMHVLQGNFRKDRHGRSAPDSEKVRSLKPPEHLDDETRACWLELAAPAMKCGLLTTFDLPRLEPPRRAPRDSSSACCTGHENARWGRRRRHAGRRAAVARDAAACRNLQIALGRLRVGSGRSRAAAR